MLLYFVSVSIIFWPFLYINILGFHVHVYFLALIATVFVTLIIKMTLMDKISFYIYREYVGLYLFTILFALTVLASLLKTNHTNAYIRDVAEVYFYILLLLLSVAFVKLRNIDKVYKYFKLQGISIWLISMYGLYLIMSDNPAWLQLGFGSKNIDAYLLLYGIILNLILVENIYFKSLLILVIIISIILTLSRGAVIGVLLILVIYIAETLNWKKMLWYGFPTIAIFFIAIYFFSNLSPYSSLGFTYAYSISTRFEVVEDSSRIDLLIDAWHMFMENPITGVGFKKFSEYTSVFTLQAGHHGFFWTPVETAHNSFLNLFAELGILGGVSYMIIMLYPFKVYKTIKSIVSNIYMHNKHKHKLIKLIKLTKYLALYQLYINLFNVFYIDAGYLLWFVYINVFIIFNLALTLYKSFYYER